MKKEVGAPEAAGFTIIEVMLFLAISGALVVALLVTVGSSVGRQRFSDAIVTTQAFVQSQYNEALNVVNTREAAGCSTGAGGTVAGGGSIARGASDCVVLGRALVFTPGSSKVTTYPVIGMEPATPSTATGAALIAQYQPGIDTAGEQSFNIPWEEPVASINPSSAERVLLLRSPESGLVLTFGGLTIQDAIAAGVRKVNICIKTQDITGTSAMISLSPISGSEGVITKFDLSASEQGSLC